MLNIIKRLDLIFLITLATLALGCVSVDIAKPTLQRSETIDFKEPKGNFENRDSGQLDKLWISKKSGNSISFLSDCNGRVDPSLEKIREGVLKGLEDKTILNEDTFKFSQRNALSTKVNGSVDGVKTTLEFLIFKKNSCIYILTYGGVEDKFETEYKIFQAFIKGFVVP